VWRHPFRDFLATSSRSGAQTSYTQGIRYRAFAEGYDGYCAKPVGRSNDMAWREKVIDLAGKNFDVLALRDRQHLA
jgi:hypothetical protein